MRDTLPAFLRQLQGDLRSSRTVETYGAILASFAAAHQEIAPDAAPTRQEVESFLGRPRVDGGRRSPAGRNQELAALRSFSKFATRDLGWPTNPTDGIPFVREAPRDPAVLTAPELRRFFAVAAETNDPWERSRNLALLAVLSQAGLRVHELVALELAQLDLGSATLVGVRGKGGTVHDLPLNAPTLALLTTWIAERHEFARAAETALFLSSRGTRLSIRGAQHLVFRLRQAMGSAKKISPHTFRHSAATLALTTGADLSTVAELLRHSDLNTTRRYLHLVDERRREAVRRLAIAIPLELVPSTATISAKSSHPSEVMPARFQAATENLHRSENSLDAQHDLDANLDLPEAA
jgi:integrase/recombinase XerC